LAEHHFHRPRQAEPDAYSGKLRRGERQTLLDPHVATHVDDAEGAVGEVDHQQRQIGAAEAEQRPHEAGHPRRNGVDDRIPQHPARLWPVRELAHDDEFLDANQIRPRIRM
jgi:hypothetical protein